MISKSLAGGFAEPTALLKLPNDLMHAASRGKAKPCGDPIVGRVKGERFALACSETGHAASAISISRRSSASASAWVAPVANNRVREQRAIQMPSCKQVTRMLVLAPSCRHCNALSPNRHTDWD
ncbi:hypothetical protein [Neomesorhizobium albiziae]|uniref:hypothetical protein n=1 Tax=Neomesorhizobium albiziae TaxID=335020 RepID=UPI00122CBE58|nr:hypothetical protein [Mesorhizobium albiziae]